MKKYVTKAISLALCAMLGASALAGCYKPDEQEEEINYEKTQLYVNTRYAGLGDAWLKRYKAEFEKRYAETSFEEGKTGVQIIIDYTYTGGYESLKDLVHTRAEVIWNENAKHHQLAVDDIALDISDIVNAPLTEFGETVSIADKMDESLLDYYKASDGNVYCIPWFDYYKGVIYDIDIFEGKQSAGHGFYIAKDGGFTNGLEGSPVKSAGPNNVLGDYDDGLPATHAEFFAMMDEMVKYSIVPFTFPGQYTYLDSFFIDLWVNEEGDEAAINYTFDGTATNLIDVAADGTVTKLPATKITNENGYMVFKQEGRYRSYQFLEKFVKNSRYYSVNAFLGSYGHIQSEEGFLYNVVDGQEKIAMAANGVWWENEASSIFSAMEELDSAYSKKNRRFGWMPTPFYSEAAENEGIRLQTIIPEKETNVFIKKNIAPEKIELAKKFLQFTSTDEMIIAHAEEISTPRSLKLGDPQKLADSENLTTFGRSVLEFKNNANAISNLSTNKFQWWAGLETNELFCESVVNGATYATPIFSFYAEPSLTAIDYFNGLYYGQQSNWQTLLNGYKKVQ